MSQSILAIFCVARALQKKKKKTNGTFYQQPINFIQKKIIYFIFSRTQYGNCRVLNAQKFKSIRRRLTSSALTTRRPQCQCHHSFLLFLARKKNNIYFVFRIRMKCLRMMEMGKSTWDEKCRWNGKVCMDFAVIGNILFSTEVNFNFIYFELFSAQKSFAKVVYVYVERFFFCWFYWELSGMKSSVVIH